MASIVIWFGADQQHGDLSTPQSRPRIQPDCRRTVSFSFFPCCGQCCGSGSESGSGSNGSTCFCAFWIRIHQSEVWIRIRIRLRIRIILSLSKNCKKNLDFYCFVTFLWLFTIVPHPHTNPCFGPPGSGSIRQRYGLRIRGSASGSVQKCHGSTTLFFDFYYRPLKSTTGACVIIFSRVSYPGWYRWIEPDLQTLEPKRHFM